MGPHATTEAHVPRAPALQGRVVPVCVYKDQAPPKIKYIYIYTHTQKNRMHLEAKLYLNNETPGECSCQSQRMEQGTGGMLRTGQTKGPELEEGARASRRQMGGGRVGIGISSVKGSVGADCLYFRRIFQLPLLRSGASNEAVFQGKARNLR